MCAEVLTGPWPHVTSSATFISRAFKYFSYELRFTSPLDAIVLKRRGRCGFVQKENNLLKGSLSDWLPPARAVTSSFLHHSCFLTLPLCSLHATLVSMRQISIKRAFVLAFFVVNYCAEGSGLALIVAVVFIWAHWAISEPSKQFNSVLFLCMCVRRWEYAWLCNSAYNVLMCQCL